MRISKGPLIKVLGAVCCTLALWVIAALPRTPGAKTNVENMRIGTFNLHCLNPNGKTLPFLLADCAIDIAILLEYSKDNFDISQIQSLGYRLLSPMPKNSPYGVAFLCGPKVSGKATLVDAPVRSPCPLPSLAGRFTFGEYSFCILGVHAPPPVPTCEYSTSATLAAYANFVQNGRLKKDIGPAKEEDLVILMGDLNTLPFAKSLTPIESAGLVDSYAKANWRPGPTWSPFSFIPSFARIDYVFVPEELTVVDSFTLHLSGSDHRAVITEIGFVENK